MGGKGSGRRAQPAAIKELTGNPGRRPIQFEISATVPAKVTPPAWLKPDAKTLYKRLAAELISVKLFTVLDFEHLAAYCQAWINYREAVDILANDGDVIAVEKASGAVVAGLHHMRQVKKEELATVIALGAKFGCSPRDRVGLGSMPEVENKDPIAAMAERHRGKRSVG